MTLRPIGPRLIVQYKKIEPKKGSLILPNEEQPQFATVIETGDNNLSLDNGTLVALAKYAGMPVKVENEIYLVVEEKDVIAEMETDNET